MTFLHKYFSPLGTLFISGSGGSVTGLWIEGQKYFEDGLEKDFRYGELPVFSDTDKWLDIYFSGKQPDFMPPLNPYGTAFRRMVWDILLTIPYGEVTTYGAIAGKIFESTGKRASAQAVGGAVGHNPISILIPCHRVVGSDGSLTGYAGGIDKKAALLQLEGTEMTELYFPSKGTAL
ncbi:MAG: methylated-DNA--[protein]-cysteine S-methyltransferase [Oscillospiraceae bacterium]